MIDELKDWDKIVEQAGIDNSPSRAMAQARSAQKIVLVLANLNNAIFSHQKQTATRLDKLTDAIDRFNNNSGNLYKAGLWLSGVIAFATLAQVFIALMPYIFKAQ